MQKGSEDLGVVIIHEREYHILTVQLDAEGIESKDLDKV